MAGRPRRLRLLIGVAFFLVVAVIYLRRAPPATFDGFIGDSIGGGAVLRPNEDKDGLHLDTDKDAHRPSSVVDSPQGESKAVPAALDRPPHTTSLQKVTHSMASVPFTPTTTATPHNSKFYTGQEQNLPVPEDQARVEISRSSGTSSAIHWSRQTEHFPVTSTIQLPKATPKALPSIQYRGKSSVAKEELEIVRQAMQHSWQGYKQNAWGADEVMPVTGNPKNPFNGWGATLVDSLDTLWIMGMKAEFEEAVEAVAKIDFTTSPRPDIPLFEVTIRYLGGLLGAYDVSQAKYKVLLDKAVELAEILFGAFDTPNRMPQTYYRWRPAFASQPHRASTRVIMAELGSLSVEFTRLAQLTKEPKYYDAIARITDALEELQNKTLIPGMWPLYIDASGCQRHTSSHSSMHEASSIYTNEDGTVAFFGPPVEGIRESSSNPRDANSGTKTRHASLDTNTSSSMENETAPRQLSRSAKRSSSDEDDIYHECTSGGLASTNTHGPDSFTLGGMSDSAYEYLAKQYIMLGGTVDQYRSMYIAHAEAATKELFFRPMVPDEQDILISGHVIVNNHSASGDLDKDYRPRGEHLSCFAGGMFAMAGKIFDRPGDVDIGSKLTAGCVWAYNVTATGIMPEIFEALACKDRNNCPWNQTAYWEKLDPYASVRTQKPSLVTYPSHPVDTAAPNAADAVLNSDHLIKKRQLGENVAESFDATPSLPQLSSQTDLKGPTDKPFLPRPLGGHGTPLEFHRPEPLTHEAFVRKKIEQERLPPGIVSIWSSKYILRPEAIESVFYMYRITGDQHWRDVGWQMFKAIDLHTRARYGNTAIDDVTKEAPDPLDSMESFWTAETLKYFYLLFDDKDNWSLDDWVLNTEAHLFRRPRA